MRSFIKIDELIPAVDEWRRAGDVIGFVPTMGALHEGHISLVTAARAQCTRVVVSIFVNPTQFGPNEDFSKYPRTLKEDVAALSEGGGDAVFCPLASEIYPEGFGTYVHNPTPMAQVLCGASRSGHFQGVLTVVAKLFHIVRPDHAYFGRKDYQQFRLIAQMARDLALPVSVHGCPIVREEDGLAKSSRNRYLSPEERASAAQIYAGLQKVKAAYIDGKALDTVALERVFLEHAAVHPALKMEYAELRRARDLSRPEGELDQQEPLVFLVACRVGTTRLIDNLELGPAS